MQQNVFPNHARILCFGLRICIIFVLPFCMCIYICIQLLQYCHYQHLFHIDLSSSLHRSLHIFSHLQHASRQMSKKLKNGNIKWMLLSNFRSNIKRRGENLPDSTELIQTLKHLLTNFKIQMRGKHGKHRFDPFDCLKFIESLL